MLKKITFFLPIVLAITLWGFFDAYEKKNFEPNPTYPCVSYTPHNIDQKERYIESELRADILKIKRISNCIRIYSVTNGLEVVPKIAEELKMEVIIGAWLDKFPEKNRAELINVIALAQTYKNIRYVVVGNETILMHRVRLEYLIEALVEVKKHVSQPVTTADNTLSWENNPILFKYVDFVGLHEFPYWRGITHTESLDDLKEKFETIMKLTNKEIVLLEFGWPSDGIMEHGAVPGLIQQRQYLKNTIDFLESNNIHYNIIEGIDVPSKLNTTEGLTGIHWGLLTQNGTNKHIFTVYSLLQFILLYVFLFSIIYLYNKPILVRFKDKIKSTEYILIIGSTCVAVLLVKFYLLYLSVMVIFQICFTLLAMYGFFECFHKYIQLRYAKHAFIFASTCPINTTYKNSLVSVFVAGKNESSSQVIKTLVSILQQTHELIEVLYIDNNSKNKDSFNEVSEYFSKNLFPKLKLFYEERIVGFKAGALNYLLEQANKDSQFVAVVDADYVVYPKWIETALKYADDRTGFVQFPQAYRLSEESYKRKQIIEIGSTVEQRYVFDIVYPIRSLIGNVVQNGTMVMISRSCLNNGWPTYSICEDAALGLEMSVKGATSVYVPIVMGLGSNLQNFTNLRKQRNRWVFGAMQIIQRGILHPRTLLNKTFLLFCIDWLGWIMHGLYPILLISSLGYVCFLWLVYLYIVVNWVMIVGFVFVIISLALFIFTYLKTYAKNKHKFLEIYSLLAIEFGLVNTITKSVLTALIQYKAMFVTTRQNIAFKTFDVLSIAVSATIVSFGIFLYIVLIFLGIPVSVKLLGIAQLSVVLFPQFAYLWLRFKY
ncbi:MAG: glycosyltransferase [Patescibacteria group bacterium]